MSPSRPPLEILPLTAERVADLADLFGQGGDPKWCWCYWQVGAVSPDLPVRQWSLTSEVASRGR